MTALAIAALLLGIVLGLGALVVVALCWLGEDDYHDSSQ